MKTVFNKHSIEILPDNDIEMVYLEKLVGSDENLDIHAVVKKLCPFGSESMYGVEIKKKESSHDRHAQ